MSGRLGGVVRYIRRVAGDPGEQTDVQLLGRFLDERDEGAFAVLVERHGPLVLGVCRRVLHDPNDVDDVFQATFLVLARKAGSIRKRASLASWLYGVAARTALKVRSKATMQRDRHPLTDDLPQAVSDHEADWRELRPLLDEELSRLPEKYRQPLILCYLEGKTNEQAARELGTTKGTISGRLARARALLRQRLVRRGLTFTPAVVAALLCEQGATAAVPAPLLVTTVNLAARLLGHPPLAGGSTKAVSLAEGVIRAMFLAKMKILVGMVLTLAVLGTGVGVLSYGSGEQAAGQALVLPGQSSTRQPAGDRERLQGTWEMVSGLHNGTPPPVAMGKLKLTFDGDHVEVVLAGKNKSMKYRLDASARPRHIDMWLEEEEQNPGLGIYELKGNTLKLCIDEAKHGRPTAFDAPANSRHTFMVLRRVGSGADKVAGGKPVPAERLQHENLQLREELATAHKKIADLQARLADVQDRQQAREAQIRKEIETMRQWLDGAKAKPQKEAAALVAELLKQEQQQRAVAEQKALEARWALEEARLQSLKAKQKAQTAAEAALLQRNIRALQEELNALKAAEQDARAKAKALDALIREKWSQDVGQQKQKAEKEVERVKSAAAKAHSANNLKHIGIAFLDYHDNHKRFPAAAIYGADGRPLLSWRVAILPYIGQDALYKAFKLDEPWDSPHNLKLLDQMPKVYAPVRGKVKDNHSTFYQVFTGPKTLFDGSRGAKINEVRDGTANALLVVEAGAAVPWTKPQDLPFDASAQLPKMGGEGYGGVNLLMVDGSVRFMPANFNQQIFRRLITIADGHVVDFDQLDRPAPQQQ